MEGIPYREMFEFFGWMAGAFVVWLVAVLLAVSMRPTARRPKDPPPSA